MRLFPFNVNRIISFIMNFLKSDTGFTLTVEFIIIGLLSLKDWNKVRYRKVIQYDSYCMTHTVLLILEKASQRSLESWIDLDAFSCGGLQTFWSTTVIDVGDNFKSPTWRCQQHDVANITVDVIYYSEYDWKAESWRKPFSFNSSATAKVSTKIDVPPTTDLSFCRHNRYWRPGADSI